MCWSIPINGTKEEIEAFRKSVEKYREETREHFEEFKRLGIALPSDADILDCFE